MVKTSKILSGIAALAMLGFSGSVMAQQGSDTFTASATLSNTIGVDCGTTLSFGNISRPVGYTGTDTVTIAAANSESPNPTGVLLVDGGGVLTCALSSLPGDEATIALLTGEIGEGGDSDVPVVLDGTNGQTLNATLDANFVDGTSGTGTIYIGGVLTLKPAGSDPADEAIAQDYVSDPVTLLVTD